MIIYYVINKQIEIEKAHIFLQNFKSYLLVYFIDYYIIYIMTQNNSVTVRRMDTHLLFLKFIVVFCKI